MEIEKRTVQLERYNELFEAVITYVNRYLIVLKKVCDYTEIMEQILLQIYAYNPEARIQIASTHETYKNLLEEQGEAIMNFGKGVEDLGNHWKDMLQEWVSVVDKD